MLKLQPLSPHLQTYRLPLNAWLSILHRGTGVFLALGLPLFAWAFDSLSRGEIAFSHFLTTVDHPLSYLLIMAWTFSLFYHLCNGIRHLFWDVGYGFNKSQVQKSSYAVIIATFLLTSSFWAMIAYRFLYPLA